MAGLAVFLPQMNSLYASHLTWQAGADAGASEKAHLAEKLRLDSAKAGAARTLMEKRRLAERLHATRDYEAALDAFHAAAEMAVELGDRGEEAVAVLGMADCLSQEKEVDAVLVLGMFGHSAACAAEVGSDETRFHALAGAASLKGSLGWRRDAVTAWEDVLEFARELTKPEFIAYACSRLASVLLDSSKAAGVEMVNEERETVHQVGGTACSSSERLVQLGTTSDMRRAIKLLEEAKAAMSEFGEDSAQAATARMNLAGALLRAGNTANKRRAELELATAFASIRRGGLERLCLQAARQLVELHEESPWLGEGRRAEHESLLSECRALAAAADSRVVTKQLVVDPEAQFMQERAVWAQQKLAEMRKQDSDSEDDASGPAQPREDGWRKA
mmetsp:Transcript_46787/g.146626  ORF Transcript_46787/g.146626 Transcript_46787/m.146626 type:complete len:390 (+) Transcript_46787:43-1212(+)